MNPFQRARDEALQVRQVLLGARAHSAVHVRDFLSPGPVETRLNLGVDYVAQGSQELGDAEAVLRRNEEFIYVRKDFSEVDRAYLVAHELGHLYLDDTATLTTIASLKSLAGGETSPAVVKVEAYGARERQELRANVFARELLLPRAVARQLFFSGIGPRQSCEDYGIHIDIVRQQMLDAVLLPDVSPATEVKHKHTLSRDQLAAAQATERFANIVAGPGSGKTTTLVHRVQHLIKDRHVDPNQILVLTFTNKAAFELVDRLKDAGIASASDVWAGTFHAFGLEFLRKYHDVFGLDSEIIVADRLASVTMLNAYLPQIDLQYYKRVQEPYGWLPDIVSSIARLKEHLVTPAEYRSAIVELGGEEAVKRRREDVATLYEHHEELLKRRRLVDFVDLIAKPAVGLQADRARFGEIADKYQYILVDEYQDVTHAMVRLIKQLARHAKSLWVVGDVRQAIHHWRGASVQSLRRFAHTFKEDAGTKRQYELELNRRSSPEILELVKHVGREHVLEQTLPLADTRSTLAAGPRPTLVRCTPPSSSADDTRATYSSAVAAAVAKLHAGGVRYGNQAVLARGNFDLRTLAATLAQAKIPVLYIGELAQREEVKRLLCLMQIVVERQPRTLIGLSGIPEVQIDIPDFDRLMAASTADPKLQRGRWRNNLPDGLSGKAATALARISAVTTRLNRQSSPWAFVCDVLLESRFCLPDPGDTSIAAHVKRMALWQFAYTTRMGDGDRKRPTLVRFLLRQQLRQRIRETYGDREMPPEAARLDAVRMLTVHGSKGLEFDAVHVSNVSAADYGFSWPSWKPRPVLLELVPPEVLGGTAESWEEEATAERNNLLYVAVSRARKVLYLYEDGEDEQKRTPQLQGAAAAALCTRESFEPPPVSSADSMPTRSRSLAALEMMEFMTYAACPLQHQYRYELKLRSEADVDVSARARWAIDSALEDIAEDPKRSAKDSFLKAWDKEHLPAKADDPKLWKDSVETYQYGRGVIQSFGGKYAKPHTTLDGLTLKLPWILTKGTSSPEIAVVRASVDLYRTLSFWRPMLNHLQPRAASKVTVHSLVTQATSSGKQSGGITNTNAYRAVQWLRAGDRRAIVDRHCAWCAYATICPTQPNG